MEIVQAGFYPPPPPPPTGHIPAVRLKSEIPDRRMDPPPCVQNAMMTKDKKPFTYTPGGIDLSEIKSPRMARRIERNANYGGVSEVPRPPPPPQNVGPLPPSALAAMNPQIQVQVLPSGGIPAPKGCPPPPPPPPSNAPPPPPMQPLPTQKVVTSSNQVVERPDMTKIIPDNPMALLRKTGGPQPRRSLVDELFDSQTVRTPPATQQQAPEPPMRFHQPAISPQLTNNFNQVNNNNQFNQMNNRVNNHVSNNNQSPKSPEYSSPEPQRYPNADKPRFQAPAPIIERQPSITKPEPPVKTVTAQLGSLYIPPTNQQPNQQRVVSPPSPPERMNSPKVQSPGTPTLKEAPRPWQKAPKQQEEVPPWARREEVLKEAPSQMQNATQQQQQQPNHFQNRQPQFQQQQSQAQPQQQQTYSSAPIHIEIRAKQVPGGQRPAPRQQPSPSSIPQNNNIEDDNRPNVVYVTQPLVLKHPGSRGPASQPNSGIRIVMPSPAASAGVGRIVPIQMEASPSPGTPTGDRSLNRQQSWSNNPTQSNSFKIIQKMTHTDEDEDDENQPITSHSPKYPQNFQQQSGMKQGPKSPQVQPANNRGPQVRTIPIQLEGDGSTKPYVHPSEQVVPEPKKYMGSSIPSRSFKILQAMTSPDTCGPDQSDL